MKREPARVREGGRNVFVSASPADRIAAFVWIVNERTFAKVDGVAVDLFTAAHVVALYNALSPVNQAKLAVMPVQRIIDVTWKMSR